MKITYYGHSCFGIELSNSKIVFDPFIRPNELADEINLQQIKADYIVVSHAHMDHTADLIELAKLTGAKVISNFEIIEWTKNQGIENVHPMNTGGQFSFDFGELKAVFAAHSSSFADGSYGGNPNGYIIRSAGKTLYYAGDTALSSDMKLIGDLENLDVAILPIGDNFTMGISDAIIASDFIQCNEIIGMHYDTFPPIKIDHKKAIQAFKDKDKRLRLLSIGETIAI
jgi:L-ascorbate metabolism protein UlaG (beta-lactamase superfamily)